MRVLIIAACVATLTAAVAADCGSAPTIHPFKPSSCAAYVDCDSAFCACVGASNSSRNASTCLSGSSATCATIETCLNTYTGCIVALASQRQNSDAACNATGTAVHAAILQAAVDMYPGSALQNSCRHHVCRVLNYTTMNCSLGGANYTNVCRAPVTVVVYSLRVTIRLSGSNWAELLSNTARRQSLENALKNDLALLLGVPATFIEILNLSVGSLVIDFAVVAGSGKSAADLDTAVRTAGNNTNWLTTTKSVYSLVSNETITVIGVVLVAGGTTSAPIFVPTPGGTPTVPTPTGPSPTPSGQSADSSASATSVAAAALAVLGLFLAM